jgi:hypothetical protein
MLRKFDFFVTGFLYYFNTFAAKFNKKQLKITKLIYLTNRKSGNKIKKQKKQKKIEIFAKFILPLQNSKYFYY